MFMSIFVICKKITFKSNNKIHQKFSEFLVVANKGIWWMPWHQKTMKDVAICDKLRWGDKQPLTRRFPNGETLPLEERKPLAEFIG